MNTLIKMVVLLMVLNTFMYIGVNFSISADGQNELNKVYKFQFKGDLLDQFLSEGALDKISNNTKNNWTSYGLEINSSFNNLPEQQTGILQGSGVNFLDSLKIVWSVIVTLGNIIQAPLTLFFNFRMPPFIGIMIGFPYFIILLLCIVFLIRGVGD